MLKTFQKAAMKLALGVSALAGSMSAISQEVEAGIVSAPITVINDPFNPSNNGTLGMILGTVNEDALPAYGHSFFVNGSANDVFTDYSVVFDAYSGSTFTLSASPTEEGSLSYGDNFVQWALFADGNIGSASALLTSVANNGPFGTILPGDSLADIFQKLVNDDFTGLTLGQLDFSEPGYVNRSITFDVGKYSYTPTLATNSVPEPTSVTLFALGTAAVLTFTRRKKQPAVIEQSATPEPKI